MAKGKGMERRMERRETKYEVRNLTNFSTWVTVKNFDSPEKPKNDEVESLLYALLLLTF